jgi:hypothetical protein
MSEYEVVHVQDPMFLRRQVFVKAVPGAKLVPSGTVTSATNCAQSQVESACAGRAPKPAAGTNESSSAANIKVQPSDILDFMTVSLSTAGRQ